MLLSHYRPWQLIDQFNQAFSHELNRRNHSESVTSASIWKPLVDAKETEQAYTLAVEIAGVEPSNIDISIEGETLVIQGERTEETEKKADNIIWSERSFGKFFRQFSLPDNADLEQIEAKNKYGVLEITIPKKSEPTVTTRKIKVKH